MSCVRNLRDSVLKIQDGTPVTPLSVTVSPMKGDLAFTVATPSLTIKHRGALDSRKVGDEMEMDVSFSFSFQQWSYASGVSTGTSVVDALLKQGGASAWVSTHGACDVYAVNLVFEITDPSDTSKKETLTFVDFHAESIQFKEGDDAHQISVSGRAFAQKPTRAYA